MVCCGFIIKGVAMLLLLSPAKKQDFEHLYSGKAISQCQFLPEVAELVECLRQYDEVGLQHLMKISPSLAALNLDRFRKFSADFNKENAKPAALAFQGDVYQGLRADKMNTQQLDFLQGNVRILSGLYGLLKPLDLIQPYRLEMKVKLITPKGGDLIAFWGRKIAQALNNDLNEQSNRVVVNLASQEYFKSVNLSALEDAKVITVDFKIDKGDGPKSVGLYAKKARGLMARYVVENEITMPEDMQSFTKEAYHYKKNLSSENHWVFVKRIRADA